MPLIKMKADATIKKKFAAVDYESNCMTRVGIARMGTLIRPKTFVS